MNHRPSLLDDVLKAHGTLERWQRAGDLTVQLSSGGLAFTAKFQGRTRNDLAQVSVDPQRVVFTHYPGPGFRGVFERGAVRIETDAGRVLAQRLDARSAFNSLRHLVWWDKLDLLYFSGSAVWTYIVSPFIFTTPGFELHEMEPWAERGELWRRLAVTFPPEIHTHSRDQVFYFDADGLLKRQDYTAEVFGDLGKAAHYCFDHREFEGLVFPTRRRVFPRRADNRPRRRPVLVWIDIEAVHAGAVQHRAL